MSRSKSLVVIAVVTVAQFAFGAEKTFSKTLNVNGAVTLEATAGSGNITIHSGDTTHIIVNGRVKPSNNGWSLFGMGDSDQQQKAVDAVAANPPIEQNGSWVRVGRIDDEALRRNVSISYDITVPRTTQVKANSGSGDVRIDQLAGAVTAHTGSGNIRIHNIEGDVDTSAGSGDVEATSISGVAKASTGSGNIHVEQSGNGYTRVSAGSGDVEVEGAKSSLDARTGSGNIRVHGNVGGSWNIRTGSGDVVLTVPPDGKFTLYAHTSSGDVHSDLPVTTTVTSSSEERHTVRGTVNGGGPQLDVNTGSGNITIH